MNCAKRYRSNLTPEEKIGGAAFVAAVVVFVLVAVACGGCAGTVAPKIVTSSQASFDGTNQNSGLIAFAPDGRLIITAHARDRYNALVTVYGARFKPALKSDQDIEPGADGNYLMAPNGIEHFTAMERWERQHRTARSP